MEDYKVMTLNEPLFLIDIEGGEIDRLIGLIIERKIGTHRRPYEFWVTNVITQHGFIVEYEEDDENTAICEGLYKDTRMHREMLKFYEEDELRHLLECKGCPLIEPIE